jgi:peptide chain release factor subunit 1
VAETITWERLRRLAGFRAEKGCAVSLYLDLDPSETPTAGAADTRVRSLLDEGERLLDERGRHLSHQPRLALKNDLERIRRWYDEDFDRAGSLAVAVFAAGLDNFWTTLPLGDVVDDEVRIGPELYLAPLVRLVGRGEGALVAVVGRERGRVFRLHEGRLVDLADRTEDTPGRHDQGGWSQANYERHIEALVDRHLRRVAATLDRCVRGLGSPLVVLVGAEEIRREFEEMLSTSVRSCLLGWTSVEAHADAPQLLAAVRPLLGDWWAGREQALLDRWREEAARNGRAATGWEQTLEAASDGRIELLLVQDGADHPAYRCPRCGRAQITDGSCPLDGTTMEMHDGGLDLAVHQTLAHGGKIEVIRELHDLEPVGGVGALLRY